MPTEPEDKPTPAAEAAVAAEATTNTSSSRKSLLTDLELGIQNPEPNKARKKSSKQDARGSAPEPAEVTARSLR